MRLRRLFAGDVRFQWRHGFYALYAVFTAVYLLTIAALPHSAKQTGAAVMIFTDPAAMGLFFMGAITLMEKSQRVDAALSASPVRVWEYCAAKLGSLLVIGLIVAAILALAGGIFGAAMLIGVTLASILCSACGMIAATMSNTLNQFVLYAAPFEMFICLPPIITLFGVSHPALLLHPGCAAFWLINGGAPNAGACIISLAIWAALSVGICVRAAGRYVFGVGGEKA